MSYNIALYGRSGSGKTTLAANIGASLVEAGFTVVLVGCDLEGESCSLLHNGRTRERSGVTAESVIHLGYKGIGCVEPGEQAAAGTNSAAGIDRFLRELEQSRSIEKFGPDYVLYDLSGENSSAALHAVMHQVNISRLFVVTTAELGALQTANDAFRFLERYNDEVEVPVPMGGVILNNIASSFEEAFVNDFAYHANARTIGKVPRSRVVRQCELYGKTVIEFRPQSNQSYYYRRLANQIVDATEAIYSGNLPQPMSTGRLRAWSLEWADRIYSLENGLVSDGAAI